MVEQKLFKYLKRYPFFLLLIFFLLHFRSFVCSLLFFSFARELTQCVPYNYNLSFFWRWNDVFFVLFLKLNFFSHCTVNFSMFILSNGYSLTFILFTVASVSNCPAKWSCPKKKKKLQMGEDSGRRKEKRCWWCIHAKLANFLMQNTIFKG